MFQIMTKGNKTLGVEFIHDGIKKKVRNNKEVILSAGAVGSPKILMLSGDWSE